MAWTSLSKKVALNLFKGYIHISRLKVHNPENELIYAKNAEGKLVGTPTGKKCEWETDYIAKVDLILIKINVWRILSTMGKEFELQNLSIKGIHFSVEKPNTNLKEKNSNIEYVINHLDSLGLLPPPEDPDAPKPDAIPDAPKPEEPKKEEEEEPKKEDEKDEKPADLDIPAIIIHKIELGDIGAGVCIRNVKFLGKISFHPTIGLIEFDDVQQQIFGGKEDLKPEEMVGCIITAIANHVFNSVVKEMPKQLARAISGAGSAMLESAKSGADLAMKKLPCMPPEDRPGSPIQSQALS